MADFRRSRARGDRRCAALRNLGRVPVTQSQGQGIRGAIRVVSRRPIRDPRFVRHQRARSGAQGAGSRTGRRGDRACDHVLRDGLRRSRLHGAAGLRRRDRGQRLYRPGLGEKPDHAAHTRDRPGPLRRDGRRSGCAHGNLAAPLDPDRRGLRAHARRSMARTRCRRMGRARMLQLPVLQADDRRRGRAYRHQRSPTRGSDASR